MLRQDIIQPETEGGWVLVKSYSDNNKMIRQDETGDLYEEAIDPQFTNRTYTETDISISSDDSPDQIIQDKAEAYDIVMGETS